MATLTTIARLAQNPDFIARIKVAIIKMATVILNEEEITVNHAERLALAIKVLLNPDRYTQLTAISVIYTSDIENNDCEDTAIEDGIANIWDSYALGGI